MRFDRAYFDKWYRHRRHRVTTPAEVARRVALVVGVAEMLLERPVQSVLDVGCGEGAWRAPLRTLRPRVRYVGVDASPYAVRRFGRYRKIVAGTLGTLGELDVPGPFDVIVCVDVLHYLEADEVERGLRAVRRRLGGVAYLPVWTSGDDVGGDVRSLRRRSSAWYRARLRAGGLWGVGMDCYVTKGTWRGRSEMQR